MRLVEVNASLPPNATSRCMFLLPFTSLRRPFRPRVFEIKGNVGLRTSTEPHWIKILKLALVAPTQGSAPRATTAWTVPNAEDRSALKDVVFMVLCLVIVAMLLSVPSIETASTISAPPNPLPPPPAFNPTVSPALRLQGVCGLGLFATSLAGPALTQDVRTTRTNVKRAPFLEATASTTTASRALRGLGARGLDPIATPQTLPAPLRDALTTRTSVLQEVLLTDLFHLLNRLVNPLLVAPAKHPLNPHLAPLAKPVDARLTDNVDRGSIVTTVRSAPVGVRTASRIRAGAELVDQVQIVLRTGILLTDNALEVDFV